MLGVVFYGQESVKAFQGADQSGLATFGYALLRLNGEEISQFPVVESIRGFIRVEKSQFLNVGNIGGDGIGRK